MSDNKGYFRNHLNAVIKYDKILSDKDAEIQALETALLEADNILSHYECETNDFEVHGSKTTKFRQSISKLVNEIKERG